MQTSPRHKNCAAESWGLGHRNAMTPPCACAPTDDREMKRRTNEEALRVDRRHKLLFEAESSARRNAAITMKWTVLYQIDTPMDLHQEMKAQEAACWRIIEAKDNLIRDFQAELKAKDEQYVKALRQGVSDLDILVQEKCAHNAHRQTLLFEQELEGIETAFEAERTELVDRCRQEWDDLFERSYQQQMRHKATSEKRVDNNQNRLMLVQRHDTEDFYTLKVRLETEVQNLEQQLEDMRATYQLNTEKLEYNFRVLHERNEENRKTISANKRKLARLQDNLSNLKGRYASLDAKYKSENQELSEAFKRYTQLLMDLGDKLSRFIAADSQRFQDVWSMHEDEVKAKLLRLLQADKLIHEQQLGLLWFPPSEQQLNDMFEEQRKEAFAEMRKRMLLGNPNMRNSKTAEAEAEEAEEQRVLAKTLVQSPGLREMCQMVSDNADFLHDAQLRKLLASLPHDKASAVSIKNVFTALGIHNVQDAQMLQLFFTSEAQQATPEELHAIVQRMSSSKTASSSDDSPDRLAPSLGVDDMVVSDGEVVECLKHFLTYRNAVTAEEAGEAGACVCAHLLRCRRVRAGVRERAIASVRLRAPQSASEVGAPARLTHVQAGEATMPRSMSGSNLASMAESQGMQRSSSGNNLSGAMQSPRSAPAATAAPMSGSKSRHATAASVDPLTGKRNVLSGKAASSIWNTCASVVRRKAAGVRRGREERGGRCGVGCMRHMLDRVRGGDCGICKSQAWFFDSDSCGVC